MIPSLLVIVISTELEEEPNVSDIVPHEPAFKLSIKSYAYITSPDVDTTLKSNGASYVGLPPHA